MRINKLVLSAVAIAVLAGGSYMLFAKGPQDISPAAGDAEAAGGPPPGMPVEAVAVKTAPMERAIEAVGTLQSNESVVVRPEITGRISEISFEEGQSVEKGAVLVRLDDATYRAQLAQAEAALALSRANFSRADDLFKKKTGSQRALDEARAKRDADAASVALAKATLDKTSLKASFDGSLGLRQVSVGDYVTPGQAIVNLEDLSLLKVDFRVPEIYLTDIANGQDIEIIVDALPGQKIHGKVFAIDPRVDAAGRSLVVRAMVDNEDGVLRPGLFARVNLVVDSNNAALQIPEQALMPQGEKQFVYRVVDGKAEMTEIKTGLRRSGMVQVVSGLSDGDSVVTAGQMKIQPGAPVTVMPAAGASQ
ncbi:MAG: efflux RND transporter periplasmic adaptor subunit [Alphaproteobacteria bacterium]|nr:efflux RND transporter periplasmic adaptor subunit [Alphaproteobacteria bacterium]